MKRTISLCEYLKSLPVDTVIRSLSPASSLSRSVVSSSMIRDLCKKIATPESLDGIYKALSLNAKKYCIASYLCVPGSITIPEINSFDHELLKSLLVYCTRDDQGVLHPVGFAELEELLVPIFIDTLKKNGSVILKKESEPFISTNLLNDLLIILKSETSGQIKWTKTNGISKNSLMSLNKLMHKGALCSLDYVLEIVVRHTIDFATEAMLIGDLSSQPTFHHDNCLAWLSQPQNKLNKDFYDYLQRGSVLPNILLLQSFDAQRWIKENFFPLEVRSDVLSAMGLLEFTGVAQSRRADGQINFRIMEKDHAGHAYLPSDNHVEVTVLPDFSVLLPREISPLKFYWFLRTGSIVSYDHIYRGVIQKETLFCSLAQGVPGEALLTEIGTWKAPANVLATIREWIREFYRVSVSSDTILAAADERVTRQISNYGPLKNIIEPIASHTVFRIKPGHEEQVRQMLHAMGFDARSSRDPQITQPDNLLAIAPIPFEPVIDFSAIEVVGKKITNKSKYSAELKKLDQGEIYHVIDYAILMGNKIKFEYKGCKNVRKGIYSIKPTLCRKDNASFIEGEDGRKTLRRFELDKIERIGVVEE